MSSTISDLITAAVVSSTFCSAIVASLAKVWADHSAMQRKFETDIKLESLRSELTRDAHAQLERLRDELAQERSERESLQQQVRDERQTLFVKLHDRRAEAMQNVHAAIVDVIMSRVRLTRALESGDWTQALKCNKEYIDVGKQFQKLIRYSEILFTADLAEKLETLNAQLGAISKMVLEDSDDGKTPAQALEDIRKVDSKLTARIASDVADSFRGLYGV